MMSPYSQSQQSTVVDRLFPKRRRKAEALTDWEHERSKGMLRRRDIIIITVHVAVSAQKAAGFLPPRSVVRPVCGGAGMARIVVTCCSQVVVVAAQNSA